MERLRDGLHTESPGPVRATDLFPDLSDEMDRRDKSTEQRIKIWILAGVAANLLVAIMAAIPTIFYMGQISSNLNQALQVQAEQKAELAVRAKWIQERMVWEARIEAYLDDHGMNDAPRPPRNVE